MRTTKKVFIFSLAMMFLLQMVLVPKSQAAARWNESKWMEQRYNQIKNKKLNELSLPGTHDSGTYYLDKNSWDQIDNGFTNFINLTKWPVIKDIVHNFSVTQERNIYDQLVEGNRYLDLRFKRDSQGWIRTYHGMYGDTMDVVFSHISRFRRENPNEIIIIDLQHLHNLNDQDIAQLDGMMLFWLYGKQALNDEVSVTSTVEQILAKDRPVFMLTDDSRLLAKRNTYFKRSDVLVSNWKNTSDINTVTSHLNNDQSNRKSNKLYVHQMVLSPNMDEILNQIKDSAKKLPIPIYGPIQFGQTLGRLAGNSIYKMTVPHDGTFTNWVRNHNTFIAMRDFYSRDQILATINKN